MKSTTLLTLPVLLTLAACGAQETPAAVEADAGDTDAPFSILRPDIERPATEEDEEVLERLLVTIGFPDGGDELSTDAVTKLEAVVASEQFRAGLPILIGGHSDAGGGDQVNLDASEARAQAVAKWFADNGVAADRILVIAFGEQNPIEPNAAADGAPNEAGRAANRRVEIVLDPSANIFTARDLDFGDTEID
ncbi:MAG: OmpA family protein [Pseudomonadota bacterium]